MSAGEQVFPPGRLLGSSQGTHALCGRPDSARPLPAIYTLALSRQISAFTMARRVRRSEFSTPQNPANDSGTDEPMRLSPLSKSASSPTAVAEQVGLARQLRFAKLCAVSPLRVFFFEPLPGPSTAVMQERYEREMPAVPLARASPSAPICWTSNHFKRLNEPKAKRPADIVCAN